MQLHNSYADSLHDVTCPVQLNSVPTEISRPVAVPYSCILLNFFHLWMAVECRGVNKASSRPAVFDLSEGLLRGFKPPLVEDDPHW